MKIERVTHGQSLTKNLGNFESLKILNSIEVSLENEETVKNTHDTLRKAMSKLNKQDIDRLVDK